MEEQVIKYNMLYVMLCCSVAALGGFLLGYDTSVISGAIEPLSRHYQLSPAETGWAVSNVIVGCIIGCFTAGGLCDKLGRKKSLIITATLFVLSVLGTAYATSFTMFVLFRILGGFCIGLASVITPTYLAEMAPSKYRGQVGALNMFCCVGGQVIVQFVNYYIAKDASEQWMELLGWRYILGVAIIPCLFFIILIWFIPESPRWNIMKGFDQKALNTLTKISNLEHAQHTMQAIKDSYRQTNKQQHIKIVWDKKTFIFLFLGSALAICSMSTGINVVQYFGPSLLLNISSSLDEAMFKSSFLALAQFLGVITGMYLTDKMGRLKLVLWGSIFAFFSMSYTFVAFYYNFPGIWSVIGLFVFMYTFGASWGQVVWTLISEIFPNRLRTFGTGVSISMMWATNFVIALLFPILNKNMFLIETFHGGFPIIIFALFALISLYFAWRYIPETKGIPLEQIEERVLEKFYHR